MVNRLIEIQSCIYCGTQNELTDEHIVPLGLGGDLILPSSSCKSCNAITSKFELKVLRGYMNDTRVAAKLPSRRKKLRPASIATTFILKDDSILEKDIPAGGALALLHMPILEPAFFVYDTKPTRGARVTGIETFRFGPEFQPFLADHDAVGISGKVSVDVNSFCKLLAKIAYSYYVGVRGQIQLSESPALAFLLGEVKDPSNWIGTTFLPFNSESSSALHALAIKTIVPSTRSSYEVVLVRLFSTSNSCTYEVVVHAPGWQSFISAGDA